MATDCETFNKKEKNDKKTKQAPKSSDRIIFMAQH